MECIYLPHELGVEYELYEFYLEIINFERIPNYDSYLYLGDLKKFLNYSTDKSELIFYWDYLEIVVLTFLNINPNTFQNQIKELKFLPEILTQYQEQKVVKYTRNKEELYLILLSLEKIILLYGNPMKRSEILKVVDSILKEKAHF